MKLYFYGADRAVTGSCHCVTINGKRILVDCGLQQGRDELDNTLLPFNASEIASTALFLATSDSSFIDGQLLRVDGGVDV